MPVPRTDRRPATGFDSPPGMTLAHDVQTATTDILTYQDLVEAGRMIGPRISHTGPGVFSRAMIRDQDHARDILRRYRDHYRVNTFKMYMSGNREQRQWLIRAARELELMPTVEAGLQYKLNLTQVMDGYPGFEHSLPILLHRGRTEVAPTDARTVR